MPEIFLTPASLSYLALFLLALVITFYLVAHYLRCSSPEARRQAWILFSVFACLVTVSLLFFLEFALLPADRLVTTWLESPVLSLLITAIIQFAYNFPALDPRQKIERRIAILVAIAITAWELYFAIWRILLLPSGRVEFRLPEMDKARVAEFAWMIFIFARSSIKNWKLPATRNFVLILLIPLGLAVLEIQRGLNPTVTLLFSIFMSIGLLVTTFLFALNYLVSQPEQVSFVARVTGVLLTSVLALLGTIAWLVTPAYAARYQPPSQRLDHRSLQFNPDGSGGYRVSEIPFEWPDDLGERVYPGFEGSIVYDFPFPFLGQAYQKLSVANDGAIGVGGGINGKAYQDDFNVAPVMYPLLIKLVDNPPGEGGVFVRQEPGRMVFTWYRLPSYFHGEEYYTFQAILYADGRFIFTYNGLPEIRYGVDEDAEASVWAVGIKPAASPVGNTNFTRLPVTIGPAGALQDEFRSFRIYIDHFLHPLAVTLLVCSVAFVMGIALIMTLNLARPLNSLLQGVQNFNRGACEQSIPIQSNDEIGFLTESFNKLACELNELIHSLEERVAERTQELSVANAHLQAEMESRACAQGQAMERQRAVATLEERERLARELHDGIGQVLGFLSVEAQSAQDCLQAGDPPTADRLLRRMAEVAQDAHDDVRGYILGLRKAPREQPASGFIARIQEYIQYLEQSNGFQTVLEAPGELPAPPASQAVQNQFCYVLREALSNACAHSGVKQAKVTIRFDETNLRATVEDKGKGFAPGKRDGHFGLEIMRERVESLGGALKVSSTPGSGTRVEVSLPRQVRGGCAVGTRLLLVDDHPLFLEGLSTLVAGRGMLVSGVAGDGIEALEKARTLHPDVILMDIEMPRCDGIEATRRIKAELPDIKVVMLTVSGEEQHLFQALQYGASGYLLKSLEAAELTGLLEELLRGEVLLSPSLAAKMLEAFTRHKAPPVSALSIMGETRPEAVEAATAVELSPRQMEILQRVAEGYQYKEIALQLGLAEVTIKYHMGEILARLHVNSRREAVQYFQSGRRSP